jgi:hypothetical protein
MAYPITVTKKSVSYGDIGKYTLSMNLKLYEEADVTKAGPTVFDRDFSTPVKTQVSGKTTQQLADEAEAKLQSEMQQAIDRFKDEQAKLAHSIVDNMVSDLNSNLVG